MRMSNSDGSRLFSLFSVLHRHEKKTTESDLLTWKEMYLLLYVSQNKITSISCIARALDMSILDISRLVTGLQSRNILQKSMKSSDHRVIFPVLTDNGSSVLKRAAEEFLSCLEGQQTDVSGMIQDTECFNSRYQNYCAPVCSFKPVFDADREIIDLEFVQANWAFIQEFPKIKTFDHCFLLSHTVYLHFDIVMSVCNTVWKTGKKINIALDSDVSHRAYLCEFFRDDMDYIIISSEPKDAAAGECLRKFLPHYSFFFEGKPAKLVLECATGKVLEVNEAAVRFYGWTRSELLLKSIYEISQTPSETIRAGLNAGGENGENSEAIFHVSHRTADGTARKVELHVSSCLCGATRIQYVNIIQDTSACTFGPHPAFTENEKRRENSGILESFTEKYADVIADMGGLLAFIENNGRLCTYAAGDHFFEYGTVLPTFGFIVDGLFRVCYESQKGREYTLEYLRPGYIIDSMTFSTCFPSYDIIIEAVIQTRVLVIDQNQFMHRASGDPHAFKFLYYLDKNRLSNLEKRGLSLLTGDAKERYEQFMQNESDISVYLRGQDIASYLGITPETLSRIRNSI